MVNSWGSPPQEELILNDLNNLQMWAVIYKDTTLNNQDRIQQFYWSNFDSQMFPYDNFVDFEDNFYIYSDNTDFQKYDINLSDDIYFGTLDIYNTNNQLESWPTTVIDKDGYIYCISMNYQEPGEAENFIAAILFAIFFIVILSFVFKKYLEPVQLMKKRVQALEDGDMDSEIKIIGQDELASLSKTINKLIYDIKFLINQKQQMLYEVSHELRSPLARMQLLLEVINDNPNKIKLKDEILFLELMIENLLLSDRLSLPYSDLKKESINIPDFLFNILNMFPQEKSRLKIIYADNLLIPNSSNIKDLMIKVDKIKFTIVIRNIIDNAIKYSNVDDAIEIYIKKDNLNTTFQIKDYGIGIPEDEINNITKPFYRIKSNAKKSGFGLGLTICKKVIEAHNGKLVIAKNKNSTGSVFSIII